MTNPTTPFSWQMPTSTDLVTDLPADFETFGQAVATSMADLLGGTSGQILSKASNTDMDFTWITNDVGDITAVTAGTGISGGGTSGAVTVTNSMATAIDAKGDLIVGTGADAFSRLAVGGNNTKLVAASGESSGLKYVGFQGASVWSSTSQTITNTSQTTINFDTEVFDTDGFHSNTTNNSRFTIPTGMDGKYLVTCKGDLSANATGQRVVYHLVNGTLVNFVISPVNSSANASALNLSAVYQLTAGNYVEMAVYQDSGASLTSTGTAYYYNNFQITYLGA
jgi:hypothetical protein